MERFTCQMSFHINISMATFLLPILHLIIKILFDKSSDFSMQTEKVRPKKEVYLRYLKQLISINYIKLRVYATTILISSPSLPVQICCPAVGSIASEGRQCGSPKEL